MQLDDIQQLERQLAKRNEEAEQHAARVVEKADSHLTTLKRIAQEDGHQQGEQEAETIKQAALDTVESISRESDERVKKIEDTSDDRINAVLERALRLILEGSL